MTAGNDRRHRLQKYPVGVLTSAIDEIIYRPEDRAMLRDLFTGTDMTYQAAAEVYGYSRTGIIKHVGRLTDRVETYLEKGQLH